MNITSKMLGMGLRDGYSLINRSEGPTVRRVKLLHEVAACLKRGESMEETARIVGCAHTTVRRILDKLHSIGIVPLCHCKRHLGHVGGLCRVSQDKKGNVIASIRAHNARGHQCKGVGCHACKERARRRKFAQVSIS